jgi:biofilm PGA synthesis N-glycosyltransferase PgaC
LLVCIDGDALLEPHALTWLVRRFQTDARIGGLTGNPRVRNHATLLGRLQVGEFSSLVGLIKRAQTVYGSLFTVSGVICAFRKRALQDAGWWSRAALTDDVDVSWNIQLAGWRLAFEPKALCWILMPETLRGLWRQRVRWSEGGTTVMLKVVPSLLKQPRLLPVWINFVVAVAWAYSVGIGFLVGAAVPLLSHWGLTLPAFWQAGDRPLPARLGPGPRADLSRTDAHQRVDRRALRARDCRASNKMRAVLPHGIMLPPGNCRCATVLR